MLKRKKYLIFFITIITTLFLISGCSGGLSNDSDTDLSSQNTIKGQLLDYNEEYPASALVVLSKDGKEIKRKYADAYWESNANPEENTIVGGGFEFTNLADGEYILSIYKLGYNTKTKTVAVNNDQSEVLTPIVLETASDFTNTAEANTTSFIVVTSLPDTVNKALLTEALSLAVDNDYIANDIYSNSVYDYTIPNRILPPAVAGNNQDNLINYDLEEAKRIAKENNDIQTNLTFYYYDGSDVPEAFTNLINYLDTQWKQLDGITVEFIPFTSSDDYNSDQDNFKKSGWILDNPDPLFNLKEIVNSTGASESTINKLNEAKLKLDNKTEAMELIYQAEKEMIDNGIFIVLSHYLFQ